MEKTYITDNRAFFVPNKTLNLTDSIQYCKNNLAKLAEIVKPKKWKEISKNLLQNHSPGDNFRIGLKPCPSEPNQYSTFSSNKCEDIKYYRPNQKKPQCPSYIVHKYARGDPKPRLDTIPCSQKSRFVCEAPLVGAAHSEPYGDVREAQSSSHTTIMTSGAIAAVTVTSFLLLFLLLLICFLCFRIKRRRNSQTSVHGGSFFSSTSGMKETASVRWKRRRQKVSKFTRAPVVNQDVQHFHGSLDQLGVGRWEQKQQRSSRQSRQNQTSQASDPGYISELPTTTGSDVTASPSDNSPEFCEVTIELHPPSMKKKANNNNNPVVMDAMDSGFSGETADHANSSSHNDDYVMYSDVYHEEADHLYSKLNKSVKY